LSASPRSAGTLTFSSPRADEGVHSPHPSGVQRKRADLFTHLAEEEIPDVFVITGDIHSHWVHDCKPDFDDPDSPVVATEYVGTSIYTRGFSGLTEGARPAFYANNPTLRYFEGDLHGYGVIDLTRDELINTYRTVGDNGDIQDPRSPVSTLAVFRQRRGDPLVEQLEGGDSNPRRPV
jgi:alkaline phosphatase D